MRRVPLVLLALLAVTVPSAVAKTKRHNIRLHRATEVSGAQLKAGEYDVAVQEGSAIFYRGSKEVARSPVRTEENSSRYAAHSFLYATNGRTLKEIRLGGKTTKLVLEDAAAAKGYSATPAKVQNP